jgi:ubiquinone/menaquinone biosynthesis C-methylase UbiE
MSTPQEPHVPALWASADVARAYAAVRSDLSEAVRSVWVEAFRSAVPRAPRQRLLDLGCGTGRFTALLAAVFAGPTIGIDGSLAMLGERPVSARSPITFAGAEAAALPLRDASVDLALLSMVYHLLAPAAAAVAELHRVVRPDGWVLVRTPTYELMDRVSFLPFFPEARAVDEARIPPRARIVATFERAGFATHAHRTIEQELAKTPAEALEKVRRRVYSTLRLIPDDAYEAGVARYEAHCASAPPTPLIEPLDFFVFRRP